MMMIVIQAIHGVSMSRPQLYLLCVTGGRRQTQYVGKVANQIRYRAIFNLSHNLMVGWMTKT